jgi:selenocysteine-specific elongation factor
MSAQIFTDVLARMEETDVIAEEAALVRLPGHGPQPTKAQVSEAEEYLRRLDSDPFSPPTDSPIDGELLSLLVDEGKVVKVSDSVVFSASAHAQMVEKISAHIRENGEITVADVRDLLGTSRKYALALMDDLDHQRITRRVGDARILR